MTTTKFSVGKRVRLVGLQTAVGKKMNGVSVGMKQPIVVYSSFLIFDHLLNCFFADFLQRLGEITRDRNNEGRYDVLVNGEKKTKEIREGNLQQFVEKPLDDSIDSDGYVPPALIPKAKVDTSDDEELSLRKRWSMNILGMLICGISSQLL